MRTLAVLSAAVVVALATAYGCTLPLEGLAGNGVGGAATTTAASTGGAPPITTTSAVTSSTATGTPGCTQKADCMPDDKCATYACADGACEQTAINEGKTIPDPGSNCAKTVCVGGALVVQPDDKDPLDDGDPCTVDACSNEMATHVAGNDNAPCTPAGRHCFGGHCVECSDATQCPKGPNGCMVATCNAGLCGIAMLPDGVGCADGTECKSAGTCSAGACVQTDTKNGNICSVIGHCASGGCCFNAICSKGTDCCQFGQHCNGSDQCTYL